MEENEVLESDNAPNEVETDNTPGEETPEAPKEAEPSLTKEQKSKLDSFDRIYAENKRLKAQKSKEEVEEWTTTNDPLEVARLAKSLSNYSEEETEFIVRNAPTKDIDGILQAAKDPWVQSAIQATREKVAKESKVPEPSSPLGASKEVDVAKVIKEGNIEKEVARQMEELLKSEGKEGGV